MRRVFGYPGTAHRAFACAIALGLTVPAMAALGFWLGL